MFPLDRRGFLGATFATGLAALFNRPTVLIGDDIPLTPPSFKPDTLFLTWATDPTTTIVVQWVGGELETKDTTVRCRGEKKFEWTATETSKKPFPQTDLFVFRAELSGLKPDTEYRFKIGTDSPIYYFRTMPAKATNEFTFISGGDCGVNEHVVTNNKLAAKQDPRFVLIGGDLAYDNGTSAKTFLSWLKIYTSTMFDSQGRMIPLLACLGNHEVNGGYGKKRSDAPFFFALFDGLYADTSYAALDFGDYLSLVLMDSGHCAPIDGDQTDWLETTLKERADRTHLVAVNHVPCYPSFRPAEGPGGKGGTGEEQRANWVPLFEKYNVDFVLEHHDHTFKRTHPLKEGLKDKNGILYLGDGSWGKLRSAAKAEERSYIATASTAYHMTLHRLEDEDRFHLALEESGKVVDICRTAKKPRGNRG